MVKILLIQENITEKREKRTKKGFPIMKNEAIMSLFSIEVDLLSGVNEE